MVASNDPAIAAVITLAGPGVPGMEVARYQVEQPILKDPKIPAASREQELAKQFAEALKGLSAHESSYLAIDPDLYDSQVHCPALIIQGGADVTVPVRSAEKIAAAMRAGGNSDVSVRIFPGVSHSLLPDPGGLSSGWAALPAFFTAPDLLETNSLAGVRPASRRRISNNRPRREPWAVNLSPGMGVFGVGRLKADLTLRPARSRSRPLCGEARLKGCRRFAPTVFGFIPESRSASVFSRL